MSSGKDFTPDESMCPTSPPNNDKSRDSSKGNLLIEYKVLITIVITTIILVFFILPALFSLLGVMWPQTFSGSEAVNELKTNAINVVGIVSLAVGIFSIIFANSANKNLEKQRKQQDVFMQRIEDKVTTATQSIRIMENIVKESNQHLYDIMVDLKGAPLKNSSEANEK